MSTTDKWSPARAAAIGFANDERCAIALAGLLLLLVLLRSITGS